MILGTITVHKCDGCGKIAVVHTDEDIASFGGNWFTTVTMHYCPECPAPDIAWVSSDDQEVTHA